MGSLLIVFGSEAIKGLLLLGHGRAGRTGRGGLQGSGHPFMPAVLLRTARLDALQPNA
jgi:hypothetical protein